MRKISLKKRVRMEKAGQRRWSRRFARNLRDRHKKYQDKGGSSNGRASVLHTDDKGSTPLPPT